MSKQHHEQEIEKLKTEITQLREDIVFLKHLLMTTKEEFRKIRNGR